MCNEMKSLTMFFDAPGFPPVTTKGIVFTRTLGFDVGGDRV